MGYPVTLNGRTYTLADFEGNNYVDGLPDAFEDFVTHAGDIYNDTSTTSNSIGSGSKTFTVASGKPYQAGTPLRIADAAAPATNFLDAVVTSYSGTTLVVEAIGYGGSGTKTSWTVNIGGAKTIDGTLGVSQGGTGATTAAAARTNLDTYSKTEADSRFLNVSGEASDVTMTGNVTIGDAAGDTLTVNATSDFNENVNVDGSITADGLTSSGALSVDAEAISQIKSGVSSDVLRLGNDSGTYALGFASGLASMDLGASDNFRIRHGAVESFRATPSGVVLNEISNSSVDFRVESDNNANMLFVDAGGDYVSVGTAGNLNGKLNVAGSIVATNVQSIDPDDLGAGNVALGQIADGSGWGAVGVGWKGSGAGDTAAIGYAGETLYFAMGDGTNANSFATVFKLGRNEIVANEDSNDTDFRVESNNITNMLFVDAANDHVNIGTGTDLGGRLNVNGSVVVSYSDPSIASLTIEDTGTSQAGLNIKAGSGSTNRATRVNFFNNVASSSTPRWSIINDYYQNGDNGFWIADSVGNKFLQLTSNQAEPGSGNFIINEDSDDIDFRVESDSDANCFFVNAGTNNIGMGQGTSPDSKLHIGQSSSGAIAIDSDISTSTAVPAWAAARRIGEIHAAANAGSGSDGGLLRLSAGGETSTSQKAGIDMSGYNTTDGGPTLRFYTGSERMTIYNNGDVRIGSGSGSNTVGPKFYGGQTTTGQNGFGIWPEANGSSAVKVYSSVNSTAGRLHVYFVNPNGVVGNITTSGSSTSYNTSSDYRLKENVAYSWDATTRLKQLKPARFNFIADDTTTVDGFIAHEVQAVVPEAVTGSHNEVDDEGNPVYQGIDQGKLVPLLVKTIQELEARITALENA